jgi:hypothetical protein
MVDDFIKFTWVYLMVDRTEARHIFLRFQKHVDSGASKQKGFLVEKQRHLRSYGARQNLTTGSRIQARV